MQIILAESEWSELQTEADKVDGLESENRILRGTLESVKQQLREKNTGISHKISDGELGSLLRQLPKGFKVAHAGSQDFTANWISYDNFGNCYSTGEDASDCLLKMKERRAKQGSL